jgi:quercetin dioxygenase-like cupin family protein
MKMKAMNQLVRSNQTEWKPLAEDGVMTDGIFVKILRFDEATQRAPTFLLKFEAGASYPNHSHPAGEEVFVLEGEVRFGPDQLHAGDYLYTAPGATHSVFSKKGCVLLFLVPEEVEVLKSSK